MTPGSRLFFFGNLRVLALTGVIVHHVGMAYEPTGAWWPIQEPTRAAVRFVEHLIVYSLVYAL